MARRTIRARRSSPYLIALVIIFAVLAVAASIGWGWTWSTRNEELAATFGQANIDQWSQQEKVPIAEIRKEFADPGLSGSATIVDIVKYYKDLSDTYRAEIPRLTEPLNGDVPSGEVREQLRGRASYAIQEANGALTNAAKAVRECYEALPAGGQAADIKMRNMVEAMASVDTCMKALVAQIKTESGTISNLQAQLKTSRDEMDVVKQAHTREMAQRVVEMKDLVDKANANRDSAVATSAQLERLMRELADRSAAEKATVEKAKTVVEQQLSATVSSLKNITNEMQKLKKPPTETRIAGKIVSVDGNRGYCNLGKQDGIIVGMTFSILGPNELGKTTFEPKAQCTIIKIMDDSSELRVDQLKAENPVIKNDVLFNPVYDRTRRLSFFLVGKMDIDRSGADNTQTVIGLIERYGGRVDSTLNYQTQYVILGEEPVLPPPPATTASPMIRQQYEDAVKQFKSYVETKARADNFGVPTLSLNRFIGLMGMAAPAR